MPTVERLHDFWPFAIARELIEKWRVDKQVITTGTSMSGDPHIGNANDVIRAHAIRTAIQKLGKPADLIWISDDMDPFRSVPAGMPNEMEKYLGVPASMIPDLWGNCHQHFTEHFEEKFLKQFEKLGIRPIVKKGIYMYRNGEYNESIKTAMSRRDIIINILNKFKTAKLDDDWYPINIICENCHKISTTKIKYYDSKTFSVEYECEAGEKVLHKKNVINGCGYKGVVSILNGNSKLTWRVEWAARWGFLRSTCEPFGKEHSTAGGSWDTGKEIAEKVFEYKPPYPVFYEHFLVNGEKMSKSKGNVITVDDMLRYMTPEQLKYWMFQGRLTISKNIVLKDIVPRIFADFDQAEKVYFNPGIVFDERERSNLISAYQLATYGGNADKEYIKTVPFETLKEIVRIMPEEGGEEFFKKKMLESGFEMDESFMRKNADRIVFVRRWVEDFDRQTPSASLGDLDRKTLEDVIKSIKDAKDAESLQSELFDVAKRNNMKTSDFFKLMYGVLLNSERGPKIGPYVFETGKEYVIDKIKKSM